MRWIRANRRGGSALALLALAVQLFLGLGHVHAQWLGPAASPIVATQAVQTVPADDRLPPLQTDANCDICAVLHMASAGQVATAPSLALPHFVLATQPASAVDRVVVSPRHILAQSRAPPVV